MSYIACAITTPPGSITGTAAVTATATITAAATYGHLDRPSFIEYAALLLVGISLVVTACGSRSSGGSNSTSTPVGNQTLTFITTGNGDSVSTSLVVTVN